MEGTGGGRGGGAGASEGTFSREPHFSQKLDAAAFCAPHSSQNRTDSEAMTGPARGLRLLPTAEYNVAVRLGLGRAPRSP